MPPGALEKLLSGVKMPSGPLLDARVLAGRAYNEDAAVVAFPEGRALVQTVDVLTPIVNNAFAFGRIAAANALSDVYAMGGEPWCAMSLAFFPSDLATKENGHILHDILQGGMEALLEAGAVSAGGHTVQDDELKFGLAVSGVIMPGHIARNDGLKAGDRLLLTKPLGSGILATGVKAHWEYADESEREIERWCGRLNKVGGAVIRELDLKAATDITGFGLGGHALEMARASQVCCELDLASLPLMPHVLEYARDGLIPAGTHANQRFFAPSVVIPPEADEALVSVVFDAQTSGGLLLAVPPAQVAKARELLLAGGDLAAEIGQVLPPRDDGKMLVLKE